MNTLELLVATRAKIADPERWSEDADALNEEDEGVGALDDDACRWCAAGALERVASDCFSDDGEARAAYRAGMKALVAAVPDEIKARVDRLFPERECEDDTMYVLHLNDHGGADGWPDHAVVLAAFDRAIEAARVEA